MDQACHDPEDYRGRKVYFIYPNSVIQKEMVTELIRKEFEVYLVKDYFKALTLFRRYRDPVVFINIDEGQEEPQWEEYVQTIQSDPDLEGTQIGIMTYNNDPQLAQKYLMEMMVSGGFIKLGLGLKESTAIVLKVLEANEARGRRKYLRVKTEPKTATFNLRHEEKGFTGTILDISAVGMACQFDTDPGLPSLTLLDSLQIKLKGTLSLVSGIVMGTRCDGDDRVWVILFGPRTNPEVKDKIHNYLQWALQTQVEGELESIS